MDAGGPGAISKRLIAPMFPFNLFDAFAILLRDAEPGNRNSTFRCKTDYVISFQWLWHFSLRQDLSRMTSRISGRLAVYRHIKSTLHETSASPPAIAWQPLW